jgi:protein-tyrosine phosphatase
MVARRIALATAQHEQLATEVAAALRHGDLCALPTETVYGLALLPSSARALERVRALKGRRAEHEFTFHLAAAADADRLARTDDVRVRRLIARYWPGPLTLVLPGHDGRAVGVRVPAHDFARRTIAASGGPLWLTSVNRSGDPPLCEPDAITAAFGQELAIVVDDGPSPLGTASTVVRCTGPELEVLREGILARADVLHTAAAHVLFVCTGNTCRSPMAEVLARDAVARALDVAPGRLLARGLSFASAGTGTLDGMQASEGSVIALQERGLDLHDHRSRALTRELCARATRIFCMSGSHRDAVLDLAPDAAAKTALLRPDGGNIADPYGGELPDYRSARDEITAAIGERLRELLALLPAK